MALLFADLNTVVRTTVVRTTVSGHHDHNSSIACVNSKYIAVCNLYMGS